MSLLTVASQASVWRGYEYFSEKRVLEFSQISDFEIKGVIRGDAQKRYEVFIDIEHPRKSKCNCPHADGKRIVCKHMIALFFHAYPKEAKEYYEEVMRYELEEEERHEELEEKIFAYIKNLTKEELENHLIDLIFSGPEWQYEKFCDTYIE